MRLYFDTVLFELNARNDIHSGTLSLLINSFIATNDIQLGLALQAPLQKLPGFDKQHAQSIRGAGADLVIWGPKADVVIIYDGPLIKVNDYILLYIITS